MLDLKLEAWSRRIRAPHGVAELIQCPLPDQTRWSGQDERLLEITLPVAQYSVAPHCCPYRSSARALSRLRAVLDFESGTLLGAWTSGTAPLFPPRGFVDLWLCRFG